MAQESEWATSPDDYVDRSPTLKKATTAMVTDHPDFMRAATATLKSVLKSPDEVVAEMKQWLRTGLAPDGTRMMTDEAWQWHQDYYQATGMGDSDHQCLPEGAGVDYQYWTAPYKAHIGDMNFVMMYPTVNFADGTHMPADRLREKTKRMKNIDALVRKRIQVDARREKEREEEAQRGEHKGGVLERISEEEQKEMDEKARKLAELEKDVEDFKGEPLRKEGIYTKYIWRPFLKPRSRSKEPVDDAEGITRVDSGLSEPSEAVLQARKGSD